MVRRARELVLWAGAVTGLLALLVSAAVPLLGLSLLVFRSGSMSPTIETGALAVSRTVAASEIRPGDVVSVVSATGDRVTHRVEVNTVRDGVGSLVLQGDANSTPDDEVYQVRSARRVIVSLPWAGYALAYALSPAALVTLACLGAMLLLVGAGADERVRLEPSERTRPRCPRRPRRRHVPTHRAEPDVRGRQPLRLAGVVAVLVVVHAVAGSPDDTLARYTDRASASTGELSTNKFFTCAGAAAALTSNAYVLYRFDETTATLGAADSSNNLRGGTYTGGVTLGQGKACPRDTGSSVTLNGTTGYVSANAVTGLGAAPNTFTISAWFRTTTTNGGKLVGFGTQPTGLSPNGYDRHVYMTTAGKLVFGVYPNVVRTVTSPLSYNDGVWHQVVATLSAGGQRLYVDGAQVAADPTTTSGETLNGYWRVGYDALNSGWTNAPTNFFFGGTLDDVAIYYSAAGDTDIAAAYRAQRG